MISNFAPTSVPPMVRPSYRREMVTAMSTPAVVALVEAGVVGVLAAKVFDVTAVQLALITAAPMFANLTSFGWARASRGKRKVPFITLTMAATAICVAAIATLPTTPAGAWMLTALVVCARCLLTGVITVRSIVWRHNYPRHLRGQIAGKLALLTSIMVFLVPVTTSILLDIQTEFFRLYYPLGGLLAVVGVLSFSGIRLRRERSLLAYERRPASKPEPHGETGVIYEYDDQLPATSSVWAVLRNDPMFRRYLTWQFAGGMSAMMAEPVAIALIAGATLGIQGEFLLSVGIVQSVPTLLMLLTLPLWGRLLDRTHIVQFRVHQSWLWITGQALMWAGAAWIFSGNLVGGLVLFATARLVIGIARGGGVLAWNLGHNDFASREMVAAYMGIHVTLTGVRGAIAPFLGVLLYQGWDGDFLTSWAGMGPHVFAVSTTLAIMSMLGFRSLWQDIQREQDEAAPDAAV
ncbi:MAG: MFS transporter [Phycisphaeraceae bacterium]